MGLRIEAPKQDGNARFNTLKVNLQENLSATRGVVTDNDGNFYYGVAGAGGAGFPFSGSAQITGSLGITGSINIIDGGITGSLYGTSSWAISASYVANAPLATTASYVTSSNVHGPFGPNSILSASYSVSSSNSNTASYSVYAETASFVTASSVFGPYGSNSIQSASYAVSTSYTEYAVTSSFAQTASYVLNAISASYSYTASSAVNSFNAVSSSYAFTASSAISASITDTAITASHALSLPSNINITASNITVTSNLVVNGTASFNYVEQITGSAVIVGQEYIILNTQIPTSRYAGLIVYDSGSNTTASIVWDSQNNHLVYQNASGAAYTGGGFLSGPRNTGSLGEETYPTLNRVVRGQGGDHLYDSNIIDDDTKVSIGINTEVTGSLIVSNGITGSLYGTSSWAENAVTAAYSPNIYNSNGTLTGNRYMSGSEYNLMLDPTLTFNNSIVGYSRKPYYSNAFSTTTSSFATASVLINANTTQSGSFGGLYGLINYTHLVGENQGNNTQAFVAGYQSTTALTGIYTSSRMYVAGSRINVSRFGVSGSLDQSNNANNYLVGQEINTTYSGFAGGVTSSYTGQHLGLSITNTIVNGNIGDLYGVRVQNNISNFTTYTGSATNNYYGIRLQASIGTTSAPITTSIQNYYAAHISSLSIGATGRVTNLYGVYAEDSRMTHYFNGNVGIKTTRPAYEIDVVGSTRTQTNSNFGILANPTGTPTATPLTTGGALADGTYYYSITALDGYNAQTTGSAIATATISGGGGSGSVQLSWTAVAGASYYIIHRGTTFGVFNTAFQSQQVTNTFTDTGVGALGWTFPTNNSTTITRIDNNGSLNVGSGVITFGNTQGPPLRTLEIRRGTGWGVTTGTVIGSGNTSLSTFNTLTSQLPFVFGEFNTLTSSRYYVIGDNNNFTAGTAPDIQNGIFIGYQNTYTEGRNVTAIGRQNTINTSRVDNGCSITIGRYNALNHRSIVIGTAVSSTADGQLVIGQNNPSENLTIRDIYFGNGVRNLFDNVNANFGNGFDVTINGSGPTASADLAGGKLILAGGKGTGAGTPGDLVFSTSTRLASGVTLQSLTQRVWVKGDTGNVGIGTSSPTLANLQVQGNVWALSYTGSLLGIASTASFVNPVGTNAFVQGGNSFGTQALLGTNDIQNLALETNGTVRMIISGSNGNIGIGSTTPATKLDVVGTTRITGATTILGATTISGSFTSTGTFSLQRLEPFGSAQRQIVITSAGVNAANVSTANNIVVIGPFAGAALTGSGADSMIAIGSSAGGSITTGGSYSIYIGRSAGGGITTGNNNLVISSANQTGIPSNTNYAIHLVGGAGYELDDAASSLGTLISRYAFIGGGFSSANSINNFYFGSAPFSKYLNDLNFYSPARTGSADLQGSNFIINAGRGTGTGTPGDFIVATSATGSSGVENQTLVNRIWVKGNSGNIGIGTSSPRAKLEVSGDIFQVWADADRFVGQVYLDGSTYRNGILTNSLTRTTQIEARAADGTAEIIFFAGTSEAARIINNGNVGIGSTSPGAKLDVVGATRISGSFDSTGVFSIQRLPSLTGTRQIVITSDNAPAGNISTAARIICIGGNSGGALTGSASDSLIAIGQSAGGSMTIGGRYSIHIGRNSGGGIINGEFNTIIGSGDQTNIPTITSNVIHLITGGGYELNDAASVLGPLVSNYAFIGGGYQGSRFVRDFYFGSAPFTKYPVDSNLSFYAPSATGSADLQGPNFTINAGRGTGTGTPGDFIVATSATGSSGVQNQTLVNRVWIKGNSGNVGIGTSSPTAYLDIKGLSDTAGVVSLQLRSGNTSTNFSSSQVTFGYANTDQYRHAIKTRHNAGAVSLNAIDFYVYNGITDLIGAIGTQHVMSLNGGSVGVGIVNPSTKLHVSSSTGGLFELDGVSATTVMYVSSSGNVGIGTTIPNYRLHISGGNQYIEGGFGVASASAYTAANRLIFNNEYSDSARGPNKITLYDASWLGGFGVHTNTLAYYAGGNHSWYQATTAANAVHLMTLNSVGNLGIGTTSPAYKLDVNGSLRVTSSVLLPGLTTSPQSNVITIDTTTGQLYYTASSAIGGGGGSLSGGATNYIARWNSTTTLTTGSIFDNGTNVGIGTISPAYKLDVIGDTRSNVYFTNYGTSSVNLLVSGQTPQTSDRGIYIGSGTFNNASIVGVGIGSFINLGTGTGNVAIGYFTIASSGGVAIGSPGGVGATSDGGVALSGTTSNSARFAVMGTATAAGSISISSTVSQLNGIGIGVASSVSAPHAIALGDRAVVGTSHVNSIAIGLFATTTAAKQLVIGGNDTSNNYAITDVYIGGGVQDLNLSNGTSVTINSTGGNGTDKTGGNITIAGGKGTGTGAPGDIILSTATSTTTGTTLQSLTQRVWIKGNSGNVGIGTSSPSTTLTVKGTTIGAGLGKLSVYAGGDENTWNATRNEAIRIGRADIDSAYYHSIWSAAGSGANENEHWLRFYISNADGSSQTLAMTMNGNGNVGIGTTSPAYKLDVSGSLRVNSTVLLPGLTTSPQSNVITIDTATGQLYYTASSAIGGGGGSLSGGATNYVARWASSTTLTTGSIFDNGTNVGIGTNAPAYPLDVTGNTRLANSLAVGTVAPSGTTGRIDASNDIVAFSSSDIRFKTNLKTISNPLDKISKVSGYEFDWIPDQENHGHEGHDIGVIAQEIEEILPEIVTTRESGYKAVKYEKIVPLLIEAIKEQQKQIEELRYLLQNK